MANQTVFKRYELKYLLTSGQKNRILGEIQNRTRPDSFGKATVRNLYYDTDTYLLIRRSIEKPVYKEKLRVRSYTKADEDSRVFVELKKKYKSVVYKRRVSVEYGRARAWLGGEPSPNQSQICSEIDYFLGYYESLHPTVFLSYDREAFFDESDPDFRITFDGNILVRDSELTLGSEVYGTPILPGNSVLMEL